MTCFQRRKYTRCMKWRTFNQKQNSSRILNYHSCIIECVIRSIKYVSSSKCSVLVKIRWLDVTFPLSFKKRNVGIRIVVYEVLHVNFLSLVYRFLSSTSLTSRIRLLPTPNKIQVIFATLISKFRLIATKCKNGK